MATIASLNVFLRANTGNFDKNIKGSARNVNQFSGSVNLASKALSAFGAAIGGAAVIRGFQLMTQAAADFETQLASVNTMLTLSDQKYLTEYRQALTRMSVEFGEGTATLSKGLFDIISAGIKPAKAIEVLEVAIKAAKGGMTDTAIAVDGLTTVLNAYQMQASKAAHVSDLMFKIVKEGKITFPELAENIGKLAPTARAAGVSVRELSGLIAAMVRIEKPDRAMTALRAAMMQAAKMGTNLLALIGRFRGRSLQDIIGAGINRRAASAIALLAGNTRLLNKEMAVMDKATGAAAEAFDKMASTSQVAFDRAIQAGVAIRRDLGESFKEVTKNAAIWIAESQDGITSTIKWTTITLSLVTATNLLAKAYKVLQFNILLARATSITTAIHNIRDVTRLGRAISVVTTKVKALGTSLGLAGGVGAAAIGLITAAAIWMTREVKKAQAAADELIGMGTNVIDAHKKAREALEFKGSAEAGLERTRDAINDIDGAMKTLRKNIAIMKGEEPFGFFGKPQEAQQQADALSRQLIIIKEQKSALEALASVQERRAEHEKQIIAVQGIAVDEQAKRLEKQKKLWEKLIDEGKRIFEQTRTPLERYEAQLGRLSDLLQMGVLDWDTYGRAIQRADKALETAEGRDRRGGPGEFRTFKSALIDVRGLGGMGADQKIRLDQDRNRILREIGIDIKRIKDNSGMTLN